ncbi:MAG TPA: TonB family protein [Solimonas sp.]|nr:TonB family protein [Solimonas sp.]
MRWLLTSAVAVCIVFLLFWGMWWAIHRPETEELPLTTIENVEIVQSPDEEEPSPEEIMAQAAPPPPPAAPPALSQPNAPQINVPAIAVAPIAPGNISVPVTLGAGGMNLGSSGTFGGFAGRGNGSGGGSGGGGGFGTGKGFKGKSLVPLSTARPQMPDWACKQDIKGWVEVVFTVMPNGRVRDVKLVDADPRGVFEAAAIESISNWIYESSKIAREVKQRVPMDPADCAYNWR